MTDHPLRRSFAATRLSRAMFRLTFSSQYLMSLGGDNSDGNHAKSTHQRKPQGVLYQRQNQDCRVNLWPALSTLLFWPS
jgi:hypothetical protein